MNVLITGVRSFWNVDLIEAAVLRSKFNVTKVISGLASGVEYGALRWAHAHNVRTVGFDIWPYKGAVNPEMARLTDMIAHSEAMIFITDGRGIKGQKAFDLAKLKGIPIFTMKFKKEDWYVAPKGGA